MFNKYYQDELIYLREMGREFSRANPDAAQFLGEAGADPDVERMLEGFAFLSGRLRQKLDDEVPELTHALIETFWPHYLCPVPAMAMLQFEHARAESKDSPLIPRGTMVESVPVDGTRCRFRTCYDVRLAPLRVADVSLRAVGNPCLAITFKLTEGVSAAALGLQTLRLHLTGSQAVATALLACLGRHCAQVTAHAGERRVALPPDSVQSVGFAPDEALLAPGGASFSGFTLLMDYFAFPQKFLFVDVGGLAALAALGDARQFTLEFALARVPAGMPQVSAANVALGCTPVINLFAHDADPIPLDRTRSDHPVRPVGDNPAHRELYAVRAVRGLLRGATRPRAYRPHFHGGLFGGGGEDTWLLRRRPAVLGAGFDNFLVLPNARTSDVEETLSLDLWCSNRLLTIGLGPGDISVPGSDTPSGVRFRNLGKPTVSVHQPLGSALEWRLLAHLSLNYRSLADVGTLRALLDLYNVRAQVDQQAQQAHRRLLEGIEGVSAAPATAISQGVPLRGLEVELLLKESHFDGEGDLHLFTAVMDEFFSQYVSLNSFTRLVWRGQAQGDVHRRPARLGRRRLL